VVIIIAVVLGGIIAGAIIGLVGVWLSLSHAEDPLIPL